MAGRLKSLGFVLVLIGIVFVAIGGYTYMKTQDGSKSLLAFSKAQDVKLSYNDAGELTDHGTTDGAQVIMKRLTDEWGWSVVKSELDPKDPVVNTATEYMFQMATIATHVLDSTVKVTLTEPADFNGKHYDAGTYDVAIDGRYYSQFDRTDPLVGPARGLAWTGTALSLIGQLGVGAATASAIQLGLGVAGLAAGFGGTALLIGLGLVWASRGAVRPE